MKPTQGQVLLGSDVLLIVQVKPAPGAKYGATLADLYFEHKQNNVWNKWPGGITSLDWQKDPNAPWSAWRDFSVFPPIKKVP